MEALQHNLRNAAAVHETPPSGPLVFKELCGPRRSDSRFLERAQGSHGAGYIRPPNLHITPVVRRDLAYRASATGSLYRSPLAIMAQTIRTILLASAMAATLAGRHASKAVSQGRCLVPWILA
jgi:hypothetical protein